MQDSTILYFEVYRHINPTQAAAKRKGIRTPEEGCIYFFYTNISLKEHFAAFSHSIGVAAVAAVAAVATAVAAGAAELSCSCSAAVIIYSLCCCCCCCCCWC